MRQKEENKTGHTSKSPMQLIGLIPYKQENEAYWTIPTHFETQNSIQGMLFDQLCEDNIQKIEDLKERAMEFLREEQCDSYDFENLLQITNSKIFEH